MERYSIIDGSVADQLAADQDLPQPGSEPELEAEELEFEVSHGGVGRPMSASVPNGMISSPSVSAGIAAANALAAAGMPPEAGWRVPRFPGEDGGRSMAEMAQRDLDAALQLLADRAQYITGAGGAAIALRRSERNDMLCRASAGAKAPELGALLSTESGLSGESVRTRMPLRCDDAEHDPRVNQESCRDLGIASVMIVPIMGEDLAGDDQVLGVFELFSGQARAFAERDLSALQRLGEMVETAVKLARAAQAEPREMAALGLASEAAQTSLGGMPGDEGPGSPILAEETVLDVEMEDSAIEVSREAVAADAGEGVKAAAPAVDSAAQILSRAIPVIIPEPIQPPDVPTSVPQVAAQEQSAPPPPLTAQPAKRPLMWSAAAVSASPDTPKAAETDQSHVPPMLRNLRKCKACGFPVSEGRTLCVECDEKQWRGQPLSAATAKSRAAGPAVDFRQGGVSDSRGASAGFSTASTGTSTGAAAGMAPKAAPAAIVSPVVSSASGISVPGVVRGAPQTLAAALAELSEQEKRLEATRQGVIPVSAKAAEPSSGAAVEVAAVEISTPPNVAPQAGAKPAEVEGSVLVKPNRQVEQNPAALNFTGGLGASESWLAANKYILGAILVIAAVVAGVVWLR